jgi:ABC-type branched-subunit amino acid transport system substrate-binding protein
MVMGPFTNPSFSTPSLATDAQAAVDALNAKGGLHGHQVNLIKCDSQNDPNLEAACARQAVSDHVVAMVGTFAVSNPVEVATILSKAGIPSISPLAAAPNEYTDPEYFIVGFQAVVDHAAVGVALVKDGCKSIVEVPIDVAPGIASANHGAAGVEAAGGNYIGSVDVPATSTDLGPSVEQVTAKHADCAQIVTPTTLGAAWFGAVHDSGATFRTAAQAGELAPATIAQIGSAANGTIEANQFPPIAANSSDAQMRRYVAEMKEYEPGVAPDPTGLDAWLAVQILNGATSHVSTFTAASVLAALRQTHGLNVGLGMPPLNLNKPNPVAAYSSDYNTTYQNLVAKNGKLVESGPPVNLQPYLKKIPPSGV